MDNIINSTKKFTIGDKIYTVKPFSAFQHILIRQKIVDHLKAEYKADLIELSKSVPESERGKFIYDTFKSKAFNDENVTEQLMSSKGINLILSAALSEPIEIIEKLITEDNTNILSEVFNFVLGIESKEQEAEKKV